MEDLDSVELMEKELTESLLEAYIDICEDFGLETFEYVTLRRLFALYRPEYNTLQKKAEEIIDKAGDCKPLEIDDFLKKCVEAVEYTSREHVALEFRRRYRDEKMSRTYLKYIDKEMYDLLREFDLMDEFIPTHVHRRTR